MIDIKKAIKARMPRFIRTDAHKKKRVGTGWRRPKGLQNKMRLEKKGYRVTVKTGYKTPLQNTYKGLEIVRVSTIKELSAIIPKTQAASLTKVGRRTKELLIAQAKKDKITLVNLSVEKYVEKSKALIDKKEEKKKLQAQKDAEKKKEAAETKKKELEAKKAETKTPQQDEEQVDSASEKKIEEKKEKDKILTSKKGM